MKLLFSLLKFLCPGVIPTGLATANTMEFDGASPNNGGLIGFLNALQAGGSPNAGNVNFITSASAAPATLTNIAGLVLFLTNGGAVTLAPDSAYNLVQQIPGAFQGLTFPVTIGVTAGTSVPTITTLSTGITLSGTTTVSSGNLRWYKGTITQLNSTTQQPWTTGTTFGSLAQVGSTNSYTLAIVGNAVTTTPGNLVYINVTAGTLPSGWYPLYGAVAVNQVVILPQANPAWTVTAATFTPPAGSVPPTYAPLIALQGLFAIAAGVVVA